MKIWQRIEHADLTGIGRSVLRCCDKFKIALGQTLEEPCSHARKRVLHERIEQQKEWSAMLYLVLRAAHDVYVSNMAREFYTHQNCCQHSPVS